MGAKPTLKTDDPTPPGPPRTTGESCARDCIARRTDSGHGGVLVAAGGTDSCGAVLAKNLAEFGYRVVEAPTPGRERSRDKTDAMVGELAVDAGGGVS